MEQLAQQTHLSLEEISRRFSVTTQTARRDIMELEKQGRLRRLHGGAMIANAVCPDELRNRRIRNAQAKEKIATHVSETVEDGASIFLDTGTTCEAIARALVARRDLRVVSYSLRIAAYLRETTDFTIAIPGALSGRWMVVFFRATLMISFPGLNSISVSCQCLVWMMTAISAMTMWQRSEQYSRPSASHARFCWRSTVASSDIGDWSS